jgi:hypothetical protein
MAREAFRAKIRPERTIEGLYDVCLFGSFLVGALIGGLHAETATWPVYIYLSYILAAGSLLNVSERMMAIRIGGHGSAAARLPSYLMTSMRGAVTFCLMSVPIALLGYVLVG